MNYLAHIFLSGNNHKLQLGNFIGDFVKGSQYEKYPAAIKAGILLHRDIDSFTDSHPSFKQAVNLLRPTFGRYSGILVDMYFDYFLVNDFEIFCKKKNLRWFVYKFYLTAMFNYRLLPERVQGFIFHFVGTNRLMQYGSYKGLHRALTIMSHYKSKAIEPDKSMLFLKTHENELRTYFHSFMPEVIQYVRSKQPVLV